jgi:hypothetical protein
VTVTPLFTIVIYGAIFEWRRMCTTLFDVQHSIAVTRVKCNGHPTILFQQSACTLSQLQWARSQPSQIHCSARFLMECVSPGLPLAWRHTDVHISRV